MGYKTKYWLMGYFPHVDTFPLWMRSSEWIIDKDLSAENVDEGDILYLADASIGIYAWGRLSEKEPEIKISCGAINSTPLIDRNQIQQKNALSGLLSFPGGTFTFLTNQQVKVINSLILSKAKPPMPRMQQFIFNQPMEDDEGLQTEYKEVAINNIPNEAYQFAIAYLNQEGGSIYFGVRDKDKTVIGVEVTNTQRDEILQKVENKLFSITPSIFPVKNYSMDFHQIIDDSGNKIQNRYIFELEVKPSSSKDHKSAGGKSYLKTFSGRRKINR